MHILSKLKMELRAAVEEAGYTEEQWKELDEKTKKEYIKNHPNSKYAQEKNGSKPSVTKPAKKNLDEGMLLKKIQEDPDNIRDIKKPSEELQLEAIKGDPTSIVYIDKPTEKVQLEAIKQDPDTIKYIVDPSKAAQLEAIKMKPDTIKHIVDPSEEAQLEAIKNDIKSFKDIDFPTEKVKQEYKNLLKEHNMQPVSSTTILYQDNYYTIRCGVSKKTGKPYVAFSGGDNPYTTSGNSLEDALKKFFKKIAWEDDLLFDLNLGNAWQSNPEARLAKKILQKTIKQMDAEASVETEAARGPSDETFYNVWKQSDRDQYIKDHPQSKFAQKDKSSKESVKPEGEILKDTPEKMHPLYRMFYENQGEKVKP